MKLRYFLLPLLPIFTICFFLVINLNKSNSNIFEHNKVTESTVISEKTIINFSFNIGNATLKHGLYVDNNEFINFNIPVEHFFINDSFSYEKFNVFSNFIENIIFTDFFHVSVYNQNDIVLFHSIYYAHSYQPETERDPFISLYNQNEDGDGINTPLSVQQFSEFKSLALTFVTTPENKEIIQGKFDNINSELMSLTKNYYKKLKSGEFFEIEYSTKLINLFEVINTKQNSFPNEIITKLENQYSTEFDTKLALEELKAHYELVVNTNFKKAILDFKYNNFVKMPPNDNHVCFVKIPDNVVVNTYVVGQINLTHDGYTLEPYNCAGGLNIQ